MAQNKEIDVVIGPDGAVEFDMIGYKGKKCSGEIDDLINIIGKDKKVTRKREYYDKQKVKLNHNN